MDIPAINRWADFWRYTIGVNVIPAVGISKKPLVSWKEDKRGNWQIEPIPKELHDEWKQKGMFTSGMAVICGKIFHNEDKKDLYLCAIDTDNKKGIEVMHSKGIEYLSQQTLVEQHDNPDKAHFYFYTHTPMPKKSSDAVNFEIVQKMEKDEVPAIEMKGDGTHGIMYCTPSPHKDGSNYRILGVKEPVILDEIGEVVNKICDEYSLGKGKGNLVPIKVLTEDDTRVLAGSNRHEAIMRYAESILRKYPDMEKNVFLEVIKAKNNLMCSPPLLESELNEQIKCATEFISKQIQKEEEVRRETKLTYGSTEFWNVISDYIKKHKPKGSYVKCVDCKKDIFEIDPFSNNHKGHKVIIFK
jgi:hypothetical protein